MQEKKLYLLNYKEGTTCQFTDGTKFYGSKLVTHTITKSFILLGFLHGKKNDVKGKTNYTNQTRYKHREYTL